MKRISINRSLCSRCGICSFVCAVGKTGAGKPEAGRIQVHKKEGLTGGYVSVCQHCEEPACVYACLKGIIQKEADGQVVRDFEHCIGCGACAVFCPTGAVIQDPVTEKYLTCDLCGGEPLCVKFCPTGALAYEEEAETSRRRREAYGEKIFADAKAPEPPAEIDWAELERRVKEVLS